MNEEIGSEGLSDLLKVTEPEALSVSRTAAVQKAGWKQECAQEASFLRCL